MKLIRRATGQRARKLRGVLRERAPGVQPLRTHHPNIKQARTIVAPYGEVHPLLYHLGGATKEGLTGLEVEALFLVRSWLLAFEAGALGRTAILRRLDRLDQQLAERTEDREPSADWEPEHEDYSVEYDVVGDEDVRWEGSIPRAAKRWETFADWSHAEWKRKIKARGGVWGVRKGAFGIVLLEVDGRPVANGVPCNLYSGDYCHPVTKAWIGRGPTLFYVDGALEKVPQPDVARPPHWGRWPVRYRRRIRELRDVIRLPGLR